MMCNGHYLKEVPLSNAELKSAKAYYDGKTGMGLQLFSKRVTDWDAIDAEAQRILAEGLKKKEK